VIQDDSRILKASMYASMKDEKKKKRINNQTSNKQQINF